MKYSVIAANLDLISSDLYIRFVCHSVHKISACLYLFGTALLSSLNSVKSCSHLSGSDQKRQLYLILSFDSHCP